MLPPPRPDLPLFAYGVLRPGELAYFRLKPYVAHRDASAILEGTLRVREGLLIADREGTSSIEGDILHFASDRRADAYAQVSELEPSEQYVWAEARIQGQLVNVLWGKHPKKGSVELDYAWSGWADPLFTVALDVVSETTEANAQWAEDMSNTFRVQMAYLLLWTSIERYASLRYHLKQDATAKVRKVASEAPFAEMLRIMVQDGRSIQRADRPDQRLNLNADDPQASMDYYYQIRSNLIHRGKGMDKDHDIVLKSSRELLAIFRHVLTCAEAEAKAQNTFETRLKP